MYTNLVYVCACECYKECGFDEYETHCLCLKITFDN